MNDVSIKLSIEREDVIILNYLRGHISADIISDEDLLLPSWIYQVLYDAKKLSGFEPDVGKERLFFLIAWSIKATFLFKDDRYYLHKKDWQRDYTFFPSDIDKMTPLDFAMKVHKHNEEMKQVDITPNP